MQEYLSPTAYFDFEDPSVYGWIKQTAGQEEDPVKLAVKFYYAVRDGWRYNPYVLSFNPSHYKASFILLKREGHCIEKSILLIAALRALGIPARLHLAKVKNHIAIEKLIEKFGTEEITPHGMVDVFLNNKWVKVSPAFNKELCEKCNVNPLEFDGVQDSLFQEYDKSGNKFMAYLEDYGSFTDVPVDFIFTNVKLHYPLLAEKYKGQTVIKL